MKLTKLCVTNFRQFYGEQSIEFATDDEKNITIIYGENGAGKTTILNSIIWCLYGETSPDFEAPERLISIRAINDVDIGKIVDVQVTLEFEDENDCYLAKRIQKYLKNSNTEANPKGRDEFELYLVNLSGKKERLENPTSFIKRIIPQEMHNYFFFNGERIDRLAQRDNVKDIKKAVKTVLGLTVLERSIQHLDKASKELLKQYGEDNNLTEMERNAAQMLDAKNKEIENVERNLEDTKKNIVAEEKSQRAYLDKLKEIGTKKELVKKIEEIKSDIDIEGETRQQIKSHVDEFLRKRAFLFFVRPILDASNRFLENLKERHMLPSNVKRHFVDALLRDLSCICGRKIEEHSSEFNKLVELKAASQSEDIENNIFNLSSDLNLLDSKQQEVAEQFRELILKKSENQKKIEALNKEYSEVSALLGSGVEEDPNRLQNIFELCQEKIKNLTKRISELEVKLNKLSAEKLEIEKKLKISKVNNKELKVKKRGFEFSQELKRYAEQLNEFHIDEIKRDLTSRVNTVFRKICKKDYHVFMSEDFGFEVRDGANENANIVAKSTGENQITSLSFVASLISYAKEKSEKSSANSGLSFTGGVYPLVMDSPFGSLDKDYSTGISEVLPILAPQIVLMVSSTQWRPEVKEPMLSHIGKQVILKNYNSKNENKNIILNEAGKSYSLLEKWDGAEYTTMENI